jgi:uncharacterized membrane protein YhaH (DUF805 family)
MDFFEAIRSGFRNFAGFSGRAVRSEYWYFALFSGLVYQVAAILDAALFPANDFVRNLGVGPLYLLTVLVLLLPAVAVCVRRLHDLDRTGWWAVLPLTLIGGFVLLYWFCKPGTSGPNRFGPDRLASPDPDVSPAGELSEQARSDAVRAGSAAIQASPVKTRWIPSWLKVLLIILGVIVLGIAAISSGVYVWWQNQGGVMLATMEEGEKFGADKDRPACVDEAIVQMKRRDGFSEAVKIRLFLKHCLRVARPAAGFCDPVPARSAIMKSRAWQQELSEKHGLTEVYDQGVLAEIQEFCEAQAAR